MYKIGLDIGSTTAKIVVIDDADKMVYSRYERHNAQVEQLVLRYLDELLPIVGDNPCFISVTGSVGMATAKQLDAEFVQEVVAAVTYTRHCHPEAKALIDIGGEDAKVVFFNSKTTDLRMNGNCAGGTGAFIDQMALLMGTDNKGLNDLAMQATSVYPIAARCGVFAKTDVQNLISRNATPADIAASIFHSITIQTVTTLSHGCSFQPPILLCGGPLTFLPALRKAFAEYLHISESDFIVSTQSNLIPAMGCALRCEGQESEGQKSEWQESEGQKCVTISQLKEKLQGTKAQQWTSALQPLFHDDKEYQEWKNKKQKYAILRQPMYKGTQYAVIGIDSGSTTTKIIALDVTDIYLNADKSTVQETDSEIPKGSDDKIFREAGSEAPKGSDDKVFRKAGSEASKGSDEKTFRKAGSEASKGSDEKITARPIFTFYAPNLGNPIRTVSEGLQKLQEEAADCGCDLRIVGSCSTGYGENLIRKAFNLDGGIIETMAHYKAAAQLMPDVSFILDIGGQDMKAIFTDHGAVVRMELNEACSSGCGTFIQTFANSLGYEVQDFASLACTADNPCDLGTRCTVFMNSKVKQVLREGATVADIAAGLAYSVVKNCLYKVLKLRGGDTLGGKVVVQGGTMRNDAVVRAFELLSGTETARCDMPEMMGALGCALQAITFAQQKIIASTQNAGTAYNYPFSIIHYPFVGLADIIATAHYTTRELHCHGCENSCRVCQYTFAGGNKYYSGNKCEKVFNNAGDKAQKGENIYGYKYKLLFDRPERPDGYDSSHRIGLPRVLNMYENYPFWNELLRQCGFETVLSSESEFKAYETALPSVMSDNICFPAKLVHSHIAWLEGQDVERILMPYVVYEYNDDGRTLNSFNCPIVSGYSDVIRSAMEPKVPVDSPVINFSNPKLLEKQVVEYMSSLGIGKRQCKEALRAAIAVQEDYSRSLRLRAESILAQARQQGKLTILLAGRPYHSDPLVQHKLSDMIASLGAFVISDDIVRGDNDTDSGEVYPVKQWAYINRIIKAAQWAAEQGPDVHFVEMTSFGCGPDAFIQDEVRDILQRHGKPFTLLKIDDVSNLGSLKLRVRSLVESLRPETALHKPKPFESTKIFKRKDIRRKILAPFFTEYISPLLPSLFKLAGYDLEILPQSDQKSIDYGLAYANNEICYPATLIVGDIIKALKSGKYDLDNVAVAMSQTGGQCRATSYAGIIKRAMVANGFSHVPLITMGVATTASEEGNEQEGFDIPWRKYAKTIVTSVLYGDTISKFYHASAVREKKAGLAQVLRDKYLTLAKMPIIENKPKRLLSLIESAAEEFDHIINDKVLPQVGIVGEIFLKFHPFAHQYIAKHIMDRGIEVSPPLLAPFFLQEFVNVEVQKQLRLSCSRTPNFLIHGLYRQLIGKPMKRINDIASRFRYFRPFTNIYDDARNVEDVVSLAAQFGEGWLLPADIIGYVKEGINNVVSLQPFGCIANHIVSKGIEKKLHKLYPQLNMLSLDFDSGVSQVNVINRLLLFIDNAS